MNNNNRSETITQFVQTLVHKENQVYQQILEVKIKIYLRNFVNFILFNKNI